MLDHSHAERWAPILGYEGAYEVSNLGRVRSLDRDVEQSNGTRRWRGRIRKLFVGADEYPSVTLSNAGRVRTHRVHLLVLEAFAGPRPDGFEACHNNGNRADSRLVNLRWDTSSENHLDKSRHYSDHNRRKTQCPRSHLLTPPNLMEPKWSETGWRECLACSRGAANANHAKRQGRPFDLQVAADRHYEQIMAGVVRDPDRDLHGHLLVDPNLGRVTGRRRCLACARAVSEAHRARRRGCTIDTLAAANRNYLEIMAGVDLR